jgi:hypothetical protein
MMHLSTGELVDAVEGTLDEGRASHLAACDSCREQTDALRLVLTDAAAVRVPEPSPLFWDHFSARVRSALQADPTPTTSWWRRPAMGLAAAAAAAVLTVVALQIAPGRPATIALVAPGTPSTPTSAVDTPDTAGVSSNDEVWALLRAAASDMELSDARAAGLSVRPASVDEAVLDLTPVERTELERLIRAELKRAGA